MLFRSFAIHHGACSPTAICFVYVRSCGPETVGSFARMAHSSSDVSDPAFQIYTIVSFAGKYAAPPPIILLTRFYFQCLSLGSCSLHRQFGRSSHERPGYHIGTCAWGDPRNPPRDIKYDNPLAILKSHIPRSSFVTSQNITQIIQLMTNNEIYSRKNVYIIGLTKIQRYGWIGWLRCDAE